MACDPNFSSVGVLLRMDGANGSTTFVDSSPNALTVTTHNAAAQSSAQAPSFETTSGDFSAGALTSYLTVPLVSGGPLDISAGDFTIEGWIYPLGSSGNFIQTSDFKVDMEWNSGTSQIVCTVLNGHESSANGTVPATTWTAFALVCASNVLTIYINGVGGTSSAITGRTSLSAGSWQFGSCPGVPGQIFLSNIRVTKGVARYTSNYTPAGPFLGTCAVTVPNVVGEVLATAESDITAALLTVGTVTTGYSPTIPAGSVVSQSPAGGAMAMQTDPVDLVNSIGPAPIAIPNVVGMTLADATATLFAVGFLTSPVTLATDPVIPVGSIISQSPTAGTFEVPGTNVGLVESEGPFPLLVPDLTNLSIPVATALLVSLGLILGTISSQPDAVIIAGNIDAQSIAAGTPASPGDVINVTISSGLPPLTVPDLFGLTQTDAINLLLSLGLVPGAIGSAPSKFVPPGEVQAQNPSAGAAVAVGTIVSFVLSQGIPAVGTLFDFEVTVISQYANSPTILQLCNNLNQYIDQSANFANFFNFVWNVDTAVGFGLDIWGKIVGVSRLLQIPNSTQYVGFYQPSESQPDQDWTPAGSSQPPYNNPPVGGAFYTGYNATEAYLLPDDAYRQLILAKAFANITSTTAPAINQILQNLYGPGSAWVLNTGSMAISYNLSFTPTAIQLAILEQSGVIPTPPGVSVVINTNV